jgi:DNA-binding NarL/FixJ family response regulator
MSDSTDSVVHVLVVEDDVRLHQALAVLLDDGFRLTFATSAAGALSRLSDGPDVILVDLGLPDGDGVGVIAQAQQRLPGVPVIVITVASTRERVLAALHAGACGYLLKEDLGTKLPFAIREVRAGGMPMSAPAAAFVLEQFRQGPTPTLARQPTQREREILGLMARGLTYSQAGDALGVSINTVRTHVRTAYEKLQAANKAEAVMIALREGWISAD